MIYIHKALSVCSAFMFNVLSHSHFIWCPFEIVSPPMKTWYDHTIICSDFTTILDGAEWVLNKCALEVAEVIEMKESGDNEEEEEDGTGKNSCAPC
jgi:hypothetical protein